MLWTVLGITVMLAALLLIPLGLPGLWIMVGVLAVAAFAGEIGLLTLLGVILLAAIGEVAEFLAVKRFSERYGGSRGAFWGAIAGGIGGVMIGIPVPVVGPVLAGILGSFVGAAVITLWETRHLPTAGRVGWGVMLGRGFAAALKTAAGVAILVVGAGALLFR